MKISAPAIGVHERRSSPGERFPRLARRPEFDDAEGESLLPAFLELTDFLDRQVDSVFAQQEFARLLCVPHQEDFSHPLKKLRLFLAGNLQSGLVVNR